MARRALAPSGGLLSFFFFFYVFLLVSSLSSFFLCASVCHRGEIYVMCVVKSSVYERMHVFSLFWGFGMHVMVNRLLMSELCLLFFKPLCLFVSLLNLSNKSLLLFYHIQPYIIRLHAKLRNKTAVLFSCGTLNTYGNF